MKKLVLIVGLFLCVSLIEISAEGNARDPNEDLLVAAHQVNLAALQAALKKGADVNEKDHFVTGYIGETALKVGALYGHANIVKALIAAKADVNMKNRDGHPVLILAEQGGNIDVIRMLIAAKAEIDAKDNAGRSALSSGVTHIDVVKILIEAGADVNATDRDGLNLPLFLVNEIPTFSN